MNTDVVEFMQDIYNIKLLTFNLKSHSSIDIILDDSAAILLCFFKEEDDFKKSFYKISVASVKFQTLYLIIDVSEDKKLHYFFFEIKKNQFIIRENFETTYNFFLNR